MPKFNFHKSRAYFDGEFVDFSQAKVSIASSSVLYGLAIYSVFNVTWDSASKKLYVFRLADHYERLINSARVMDFDSFKNGWPYQKFKSTMAELLIQNKVEEDVLVRVSVYIDELAAGTKIHDLKNSLCAYVYPIGEILPRGGVNLCVSSWIRNPDNAIPSRAKINGSYVNASLMKNEAILNGYDDAIALDLYGHVTESTVANLFIVRGSALVTPGQTTDILEGITRSTVIGLAHDLGIKVVERTIDRSELYACDEAFVCGSSAGVTPVLSIDKRTIGNGRMGPLTTKLAKVYKDAQRNRLPMYKTWVTTIQQ